MMEALEIESFLAGKSFAVAGASADRNKWGNKVLRALKESGRSVVSIHPTATEIEGLPSYRSLGEVPEPIDSLSIVTPPKITESIIRDAITFGVKHAWMQPGAESQQAIDLARAAGLHVTAGGPCLLIWLAHSASL